MSSSKNRRTDEWDLLVNMTKRDIQFLNVVFVQRRNGEGTRPKDVAARFKDCSTQLASGRIRHLAAIGAVVGDGKGGWRPTEGGIAAMKIHYRDWDSVFTEDDERKAVAA